MSFGLALVAALPFQSYLQESLGSSLIVRELLDGLDYTLLNDLVNNYGAAVGPILNQSILVILLFLVFMLLVQGGIVSTYLAAKSSFDRSYFWLQSRRYWWRMTRLAIYFLLSHLLLLYLFWLLFQLITPGLSNGTMASEVLIFRSLWILGPIYVLCLCFIMLWHDYAKICLVKEDGPWLFGPIRQAARFVFKHLRAVFGLYLVILILLGLASLIYYAIDHLILEKSMGPILLAFLLSQVFVLTRLALKLLHLASASALYQRKTKRSY